MLSREEIDKIIQRAKGRAPTLSDFFDEEEVSKIVNKAEQINQGNPGGNCEDACLSGGRGIQVYCGQVLDGPTLNNLEKINKENAGKQWARQSIRCISESVIEKYHKKSSGILPLEEARRLGAIIEKRVKSQPTNSESWQFWSQAAEEIRRYESEWTPESKSKAERRWRTT